MEIKDLRIGNWVYHKNIGFYQIKKSHLSNNMLIGFSEPIELNEKWLTELGWKRNNNLINYIEYNMSNYCMAYEKRFDAWTLWKLFWVDIEKEERGSCPVKVLSKVHVLQNIWYMLENEELEIKT